MTSAEFIVVADRLETAPIWYHFEVRSNAVVPGTKNPKQLVPAFV